MINVVSRPRKVHDPHHVGSNDLASLPPPSYINAEVSGSTQEGKLGWVLGVAFGTVDNPGLRAGSRLSDSALDRPDFLLGVVIHRWIK